MQKNIVDIIREVVALTSAMCNEYDIQYIHGHPEEVIETLKTLSLSNTTSDKKYPLIALFQDFEEVRGNLNYYSSINLNLIIAINTRKELKARERYEKNFNKYLLPIYFNFLKCLYNCGYFAIQNLNEIEHTKIDRLFWGRQPLMQNVTFSDYIDAIEIKNLKLKVKYLCNNKI